jgi:hypothetical protein
MKKIVYGFLSIFIGMLIMSCQQLNRGDDNNSTLAKTEDQDIWSAIEDVLAPGAKVSDVRPASNILSEKEILIKAAKFAEERGRLHSNSILFTEQPKLLTAHVEAPVFIYNFLVPAERSIEYGIYRLSAIDEKGECLMVLMVDPLITVEDNRFELVSGTNASFPEEIATHYITKREMIELIESQFPGQPYEGPIAVNMEFEGEVWGNAITSWYFTVGDAVSRSVDNTYAEYLIDSQVFDYRNITGGVTSNRSAIDTESTAKSWGGHRMVKLETPVYFLEKLKRAQTGERSAFTSEAPSPARVTPVPLK